MDRGTIRGTIFLVRLEHLENFVLACTHCTACLFTESYTLALFTGYALSHILVYDCGAIGDRDTLYQGVVYT